MKFNRPDIKSRSKKSQESKSKFEYIDTSHKGEFPIEVFPEELQLLINTLFNVANFEKCMTAAGILYTVATIAGNRVTVPIGGGWEDNPNVWIAIVGKSGAMKTPPMAFITKPLARIEREFANEHQQRMQTYWRELQDWKDAGRTQATRGNRGDRPEMPARKHCITMDTTVEGLVKALDYNKYGISIFKDELSGFFKSMNRYNSGGGDEEFYLSAFNNNPYNKVRAGDMAITIDKVTISIFGGVQPKILKDLSLKSMDNGFNYRFLYIESNNIIRDFSMENTLDEEAKFYNDYILQVSDRVENSFILNWVGNGKTMFRQHINSLNERMRSEDTSEAMIAYLKKMQTYSARFLGLMCIIFGTTDMCEDMVARTIALCNYFIASATSAFIGMENHQVIDAIFKKENAKTKKEKIIALLKNLPDVKDARIAEHSECSRAMVSKTRKELSLQQQKTDKK